MKKNILKLSAALLFAAFSLIATGCPNANGLHNQEAATVSFVFTNFPADDGSYSIPGDYNDWDNTTKNITIKDGEGKSETVSVTTTSVEFSLVKAKSWLRTWSKRDGGTIYGAGREGTDYYVNFLAEGITLGSEVTITIDGSTETATVTVE